MGVSVVTDSTTCIPAELLKTYGIRVVSLSIHDGDTCSREIDMDSAAFYERLKDMRVLPTSSQPSPEELGRVFSEIIDGGDDVLAVFLSSEMSGTCETAKMVAEMIAKEKPHAKISIVDSETNSMQEGYAVLSAAECAAQGGTLDECERAARDTMARSRFLFAPQSLEYLMRGGRIGRASALFGSLLKLVPVLTVENAVTTTYAKVRTYPKAFAVMRDKLAEDIQKAGGLKNICIHMIVEREPAEKFKREYIEPFVGRDVEIIPLRPVIGTHVGAAVGVVYETVNPLR